jgi:2'-5' RNA ligase
MRLFIAIVPPAEVQSAIHEATRPLRDAAPSEHWMSAEQLHVTARFIGEQPSTMADRLAAMMEFAASGFAPMAMTFRGFGAVPTWSRARVVWAGSTCDPKLELLHHDLEAGCMALGFEVEGRPFRPHVTLARIDDTSRGAVASASAIREAARGVRLRVPMTVTHIELLASERGATGLQYVRVARAALSRSA